MSRIHLWAWVGLVCLVCAGAVYAQQDQTAGNGNAANSSVAAVPRLIKFSGAVRDARGEPVTGVVVRLTFAVYSEQQGSAALWAEAQTVQLDEQGHYNVLLGATRADGLPVELFPAGKARWLGVQVEGRDEDPRVLLVSVPYALKAQDAAMLGGRSASDFVLAEQLKEEVKTQVEAQTPGIATQAVEMLVSNPPQVPAITEGPSTFTCATSGDCVAVTQGGTGRALKATATSASEAALLQQNGTGYGLRVLSQSNYAIYGWVQGTVVGTTYGVRGVVNSTTGAGILGSNQATTGVAYGLMGQTSSVGGIGLYGRALATTGPTVGLTGDADSVSGKGIMGRATNTSGTTMGIYGEARSASGTALVLNNTASGKLVSGQANGVEKFSVSGSGNLVSASTLSGTQLISTVASGTAPLSVASNTLVPNLNADLVDGFHAAAFAPSTGSIAYVSKSGDTMTGTLNLPANGLVAGTNQLVLSNGNVGIGTNAPATLLDMEGSSADQLVSVSQGGSGNGIAASTAASGSPTALKAAIVGTATGSYAAGVEGINSDPNGLGVAGEHTATTGGTPAVLGLTNSNQGAGVDGLATATSGETVGVRGHVSSPDGIAGRFTNDGGGKVISGTNGTDEVLMVDSSGALSLGKNGVFNVDSFGNTNIAGSLYAGMALNAGCITCLNSLTGTLFMSGPLNVGGPLYASGTATTGTLLVNGDLSVAGSLSVSGTKNFKIDDPLDPNHKFLYHASVESSEMMDMYTGNVTTDAHGDAVVEFPAWFQALNRDFRYQLTVIGQFAQAIVAQEIRDNRFTIKTDKAKVKVSWQVTGVRHDAYAKAHPLQVEVDKPERTQ